MALPMQPFGSITRPQILVGGKTPGAVFTQSPTSPQVFTSKPIAPVAQPAPPPPAPEFKPQPVAPAPAPAPVALAPVAPRPSTPAPQQQGGYGSFVQPPTFSAGNNLINRQIAPAPSGPNAYDQQAADYLRNARVDDYSAQTQQARDMILKQLQDLQNAPDRFQLAQSNYDLFQKQSEPAYQQALRGVGQKAAALGRVGAGMTTNDLTGVFGQQQDRLSQERQRLLNDASANTLQDRLNIQNALQSAGGLLGGQDFSLNQARANLALGQGSGFAGLGQNQAQREATAVGQQMQQQQYQAGLDQQNIMNQIAQQQLQQSAQQQAWQQQFAQQDLAARIAAQQNTQFPSFSQGGISSGQLGFQGY